MRETRRRPLLLSRPMYDPGALPPVFLVSGVPFMQRLSIAFTVCAALAVLGSSDAVATEKTTPVSAAAAKPQPAPRLVDINSASRKELKTLPGIGDAEADRIIAARPYPSKAKLAADKVLSDAAYLALKGRIVAIQKATPKSPASVRKEEKTTGKT